MGRAATTRMSSKGQVVIPEDVRRTLGLEVGARFMVMGHGDTIVLKRIPAPNPEEIQAIIRRVRSQARTAGIKPVDIQREIRAERRRR